MTRHEYLFITLFILFAQKSYGVRQGSEGTPNHEFISCLVNISNYSWTQQMPTAMSLDQLPTDFSCRLDRSEFDKMSVLKPLGPSFLLHAPLNISSHVRRFHSHCSDDES